MKSDQPKVHEFARLLEHWFEAYQRMVTTYLVVRTDESWRVSAARIVFHSDIDEKTPSPFSIETPNLRAGIDIAETYPTSIRQLLENIARAPCRFKAHQHHFDLSRGNDRGHTQVHFESVNHFSWPGTRMAPGLRIGYSEESPPHLPSEGLLDGEVRAAKPHFPSVARLIASLEFHPQILRLPILPTLDVIAPAPAKILSSELRSRTLKLMLIASSGLSRDGLGLNGSMTAHGELRPLDIDALQKKWTVDESQRHELTFKLKRDFDEFSVALTYMGVALDSYTEKVEHTDDEASPSKWTRRAKAKLAGVVALVSLLLTALATLGGALDFVERAVGFLFHRISF